LAEKGDWIQCIGLRGNGQLSGNPDHAREELQLDERTDMVPAFSVTWLALEPVNVRHQLFRLNPVQFVDRVFELCSGPVSKDFNGKFTSDQVIPECRLSWD
jgi:hypothetical protein